MYQHLNISTAHGKRRIRGQGMTEYIIVVALIAITCVGAVSAFGEAIQAQFVNLSGALLGDAQNATVTYHSPAQGDLQNFDD